MNTVAWGAAFPADWPRTRIKHVCRFTGGGTPDKGNAEYWNGEIPWVSPKDMKSATIDNTEDHITLEGLESSAAKLVAPGAVLLVMRSGILRHSIPVAINRVPVALNQDMRALTPLPRVDARYLARLMEGHQQQLLTAWSKVGSTVESLESDLVGETEIAVPPLTQQRAIADYLDRETARLDALVAAKERVLGLLAEKRRALITRAVTRGLDKSAPLKDTDIEWLPQAPRHWTSAKISRFFRQTKRLGFPDLPVLSVYRDYGVIERASRDDNANRVPDDLEKYQLVEIGDLVINKMKAWQGSLGIAGLRGITSPDYVVFYPLHREDPRFLHFLLRNHRLTTVYLSMSNGIRTNQWRLEPDRFGDLGVFLPPLREQHAIVAHIDAESTKLDTLRLATERTIALLKERRAALIAAAVTGQIDVGVAA
jgi:type I restriction enzyme S subunit